MAVREIPELKKDISKLKKQTGTAVLVHNYIDPDIQDVADCCGDCMELAAAARELSQERIVVCGVHFVAETVALLCPDKEIILAHSQSRCPMSNQIYPGRIRMYREDNPDVCVVAGLNASAALKAECDFCVAQDNALDVIRASGASQVLFASDCNLGEYLSENLPDVEFTLWNCRCPMLSSVCVQDVELARQKWPSAVIAANMNCSREIRQLADMVGSTADIVRYCEAVDWDVIIADEASVCRALSRRLPERGFHQLAPSKFICSNMQINTLERLEKAILGEFGQRVEPEPACRAGALAAIERMLELSRHEQ